MYESRPKYKTQKRKAADPSVGEVQQNLNDIMAAKEDGDADRQQKFFNLLNRIGLPIDSADVYARRLTWPEMFSRVQEWIRDKRDERADQRAQKMVRTGYFSAAMAFIVIVFSVYVHFATRQLLKPTEKPIIAIVDSKCSGKLKDDNTKLENNLNLKFKNIGGHSAEDLRIRVWAAPLESPDQLKEFVDFKAANIIYPDNTFDWNKLLTIQREEGGKLLPLNVNKLFIYIKLNYNDYLNPRNTYTNDFYTVYTIGKASVSHASLEQKNRFQKYIDQLKPQ